MGLGDGVGLAVFGSVSLAAPASAVALEVGFGDATKLGLAGTGVKVVDGDALVFLVFLQNVSE